MVGEVGDGFGLECVCVCVWKYAVHVRGDEAYLQVCSIDSLWVYMRSDDGLFASQSQNLHTRRKQTRR